MTRTRHLPRIEPLSAEAFRPYGEVIEARATAQHYSINRGDAVRYHDLADLDVLAGGGRPILSIFRAQAHALPLQLSIIERHVLGSQAFIPLGPQRWLVVVAFAGPPPGPAQLRCFLAAPGQGVNYARGTWHHPLLALDTPGDFLVIDRGSAPPADDCDEHSLQAMQLWVDG